jgi:glyoxylase-like metal-dependent hydrolase (beta-lactamase superfamily II)
MERGELPRTALHAGCRRFEPGTAHPSKSTNCPEFRAPDSITEEAERRTAATSDVHDLAGILRGRPGLRDGVVTTHGPADHVSTLKLFERVFGLKTLVARNHAFEHGTPTGGDHETNGVPAASAGWVPRTERADGPVPARLMRRLT